MGGRGASSGISNKGHKYGTEYHTVLRDENIKFVKNNNAGSTKTPMETMTKGRVYVTINERNELSAITYYDNSGKRTKQIDLQKAHRGINYILIMDMSIMKMIAQKELVIYQQKKEKWLIE